MEKKPVTAPPTEKPKCPLCGAVLSIQSPVVVEDPIEVYVNGPFPQRKRLTRAAFCTGCEYVREF